MVSGSSSEIVNDEEVVHALGIDLHLVLIARKLRYKLNHFFKSSITYPPIKMAGTHGRQKPAVKKTTPNKKAASSSSKAKTLNKNLQRVADSETPSSPFSTPPTSPCPQGEDDCSSLINNTPVSAATLKARKKKALEFGPNFSPMWVNDNLTIKTNEEILGTCSHVCVLRMSLIIFLRYSTCSLDLECLSALSKACYHRQANWSNL